MVSSWGATETTSTAISVHYTIESAGVIGIPAPGVEIKLTALDNRIGNHLIASIVGIEEIQ